MSLKSRRAVRSALRPFVSRPRLESAARSSGTFIFLTSDSVMSGCEAGASCSGAGSSAAFAARAPHRLRVQHRVARRQPERDGAGVRLERQRGAMRGEGGCI